MKIDLKFKKEYLPRLILAGSMLFACTLFYKSGLVFGQVKRAKRAVKVAMEQNKVDSEANTLHFAKLKASADEIRKKNVFSPPPPKKEAAIKGVSGIFGDEVLIKGKWYKVGDKISDAEILEIRPTEVLVMVDGKQKSFSPIVANGSSEPNAQRGASQDRRDDRRRVDRDRGRGGRQGSDRGERIRDMRDRYRNMSEEERQELRERMRERFNNRRR